MDASVCPRGRGGSGAGTPYSDFFNHERNDPLEDVLLRHHDGGYKEDQRRVSMKIDEVDRNLNERIQDLKQRSSSAKAVFDEWAVRNGKAIDTLRDSTDAATRTEVQAMSSFASTHAAEVVAARKAIDDFMATPYRPDRVSQLLATVGAGEAALPSVPAVTVPPDAPLLPGVTAALAAYRTLPPLEASVLRERRRVDRDIPVDGLDREYAFRTLELAAAFAASKTPEGARIAEELVRDAASARYFHNHRMARLSVTVVDREGNISRVEVSGPDALPAEAASVRAKRFDEQSVIFEMRDNAERSALNPADPDLSTRAAVLKSAKETEATAEKSFGQGDIAGGTGLQSLALLALDFTISTEPVLSVGRSLYELVTGNDLITGEPFGELGYAFNVVNLATAGFAASGIGFAVLVQRIERALPTKVGNLIDRYPKAAELISRAYEGIARIGRANVNDSEHYLERSVERAIREEKFWITKEAVLETVENGHAFVDTARLVAKEKTGLIYARVLEPPGRSPRALIILVDPVTATIATVYEELGVLKDLTRKKFPFGEATRPLTGLEESELAKIPRYIEMPHPNEIRRR